MYKSITIPKSLGHTLNNKFLLWPYFLLLIISVTVPSTGQHGSLNLKSICFLGSLLGTACYLAINHGYSYKVLKVITFTSLSIYFLLIWLCIGALNEFILFSSSMDQFKLFLLTLSVPVMTSIILNESSIQPQEIIRTVLYASLAYCTLKISLIFLHILGIVDIWSMKKLLGIRAMGLTIFPGLSRFQSSVDISTPFLLFFVLQSKNLGLKLNKFFVTIYVIVSFVSNFINFSRFLFFIYAFSVLLHLLGQSLSRNLKAIAVSILICSSGIALIGIDNFLHAIEVRFFSLANYRSDDSRKEQITAMMDEYAKSPYFGKGIGGYVPDHLRDKTVKHSYEVQWIAFLMQFGFFGICLILVWISFIIFPYFYSPMTRIKMGFLALFFAWIVSGFTNPFLTSLQSGVIYTLFLIVPDTLIKNSALNTS